MLVAPFGFVPEQGPLPEAVLEVAGRDARAYRNQIGGQIVEQVFVSYCPDEASDASWNQMLRIFSMRWQTLDSRTRGSYAIPTSCLEGYTVSGVEPLGNLISMTVCRLRMIPIVSVLIAATATVDGIFGTPASFRLADCVAQIQLVCPPVAAHPGAAVPQSPLP
jgi:hypothetical protein